MFRAAAVLAAVALMTFAGCTKVDDTLGSNLVPDNQQMKVGYTTLGARTLAGKLDAAKYVETRLFQSDSLKASNISYGYMGSMLSDTFGLRTAGFESEGDGAVGTGPHHAETVEPEFGAVLHGVAHLEDEAVDLPRRFQFAQPPVDKQTAERPVVTLQKFRENDAYARLLDDKRPKLGNDEPFVRLKILRYGANQHD